MFFDWVCSGLKRGIVSTAYPCRDESVDNYRGQPEIGPGDCPEGCTEVPEGMSCRRHTASGAVSADRYRALLLLRQVSECLPGRSDRFFQLLRNGCGLAAGPD